jgi:hypothetical protein
MQTINKYNFTHKRAEVNKFHIDHSNGYEVRDPSIYTIISTAVEQIISQELKTANGNMQHLTRHVS